MPAETVPSMPRIMLALLAALGAGLHGTALAAPINPDRPDEANSSTCIPTGSFQFEGGATWTTSGPRYDLTLPVLMRWGLATSLEARVETSTQTWSTGGSGPSWTVGPDLAVGGKWQTWEGTLLGTGVATGLIGMLAGGRDSGRLESDVTLAMDIDLPADSALGLNARTSLGRSANATLACSLGHDWTDTTSGFVEWVTSAEEGPPEHLLDIGMKWLADPLTMWDVMLRTRIGSAGETDWSLGFGGSHRWD